MYMFLFFSVHVVHMYMYTAYVCTCMYYTISLPGKTCTCVRELSITQTELIVILYVVVYVRMRA